MYLRIMLCFCIIAFPFLVVAQDALEKTQAKSPQQLQPQLSQQISLWPYGAPGFEERKDEPEQAESYWVKNVHNPSLTVFLPPAEKATGAAVVVCPGGGHRQLSFKDEGIAPAKYLASIGVAAFALKYRLGREPNTPYDLNKHPVEDALRAIRFVRSRASEWNIDPQHIGMLGFSAGGEVVSMVAYQSGDGDANAADPIDRLNGRPNYQMLIYPGPLGVPEAIPKDSPPALLVVASDDNSTGSVVNILQKYRAAKLPIEVHIMNRGGHAFNMGERSKYAAVKNWPQRMTEWMKDNDLLETKSR